MMNEENKALKSQVSVLQNVTFSVPQSSQTVTSGFTSGGSYNADSSRPAMFLNPDTTVLYAGTENYWKKMKETIETALEPYVGRQ